MARIDEPRARIFSDDDRGTSTRSRWPLLRLPFRRPANRYATHDRKRRRPLTVRGALFAALKYGSLILVSFLVILPLVATFMAAFKTHAEYFNSQPTDMPGNWLNFDNFVTAWTQRDMLTGFINTAFILVVSLTGTIVIGTMAAYAIDRFQFRGRRTIVFLFLLAAELAVLAACHSSVLLRADLRAIKLTGDAESLLSAMAELSRMNGAEPDVPLLRRIAQKTGVPPDRLHALIEQRPCPAEDCYPTSGECLTI